MTDGPIPPVPPVPPSTPLRELTSAVADALTLSAPASQKDELTYLRLSRDRARLVLFACRRIQASDRDVMAAVATLCDRAAELRDDAYAHQ